MNNKDLFNAINSIDDTFITDAGKYLKNDESFIASHYADPADARHAAGKFPLMKLIAPISAAAILVCSITIAMKTNIFYPAAAPEASINENGAYEYNGGTASAESVGGIADTATGDGILDKNQRPVETEPTNVYNEPVGKLPFTLYGPDYKQITYEEVTEITENIAKPYVNDSNWISIMCGGFAYIADPLGENYNQADNPEKFDGSEIGWTAAKRDFKRIYEGDAYNGFTVKKAYSTFWRTPTNGMTEQQMTESGMPLSLLYQGSYLELDGSIETDVFLVKYDDSQYICIPRSGTAWIPTMNINVQNDGGFGSYLYSDTAGGLGFKSEVPYIHIDITPEIKRQLDGLFEDGLYKKARVALSDIRIIFDNAEQEPYRISAAVNIIDLQVSGNDIEPREVSDIIVKTATVEDLKKQVLSTYNTLSEVRVYKEVYAVTENVIFGEVLTENELYSGLTVGLYDMNGLAGIYTYRQK